MEEKLGKQGQGSNQATELTDDELNAVSGGYVLDVMYEVLSNVSKTRSDISSTFARNSRA